MTTSPAPVGRLSVVREARAGGVPRLSHPGWAKDFPWLVQGTTWRGPGMDPFDLGLFGPAADPEQARRRWMELRVDCSMGCAVHAHQVHGSLVRVHGAAASAPRSGDDPTGSIAATIDRAAERATTDPRLAEACDGHVTDQSGILLGVATADCVPVFGIDPVRRIVGALHAGWRGAAAGVLENGLRSMVALGARVEDIRLHLGPAICAACYEVGPEVFEALDQPVPDGPTPIDLRRVLGERALRAGIPRPSITVSAHCTRCTGSDLFSHRGGDTGRQIGFIGIRP